MCGGSRVFKLALELKQGSCLFTSSQENLPLPPVCDAFNTVRAQVTVLWVQNVGARVGSRVRNELQHTSSVVQIFSVKIVLRTSVVVLSYL